MVFQHLWKASGPINDKLQNMDGRKLQARSMNLMPEFERAAYVSCGVQINLVKNFS